MGASLKIPSSLDRRAALVTMGSLGAVFLSAACILIYSFALHPWLQSRAARSWPQVPCVIQQCQLVTHQSGKNSQSYDLAVAYEYTVGGQSYQANRYDYTEGATANYGWWQAGASTFRAEEPAVCHVNPQNPAVAVLLPDYDLSGGLWIVAGLLGAIGAAFAGLVAYRAARRIKFGESVLELANAPAALGGPLTGNIALSRTVQPADGFTLRLACIHLVVTGTGKSTQTRENILWQGETRVKANFGDAIPVSFALPQDASATFSDGPRNRIFWRLDAKAKMPGVDYAAQFEVPVVAGARTAARPDAATGMEAMRAALGMLSSSPIGWIESADDTHFQQPAHSRIRVRDTAAGREFYFPAFRNRGAAIFLLFFASFWTLIVGYLFHSDAPRLFPLAFGLFDVPLVWWTLHEFFATTRVVAGSGRLALTKHFLGLGRTRELAASDIREITIVLGETFNNLVLYNIRIVLQNGSKVTAGDEVPDAHEAHWLALEMARCAGVGS